MSHRQMAKRTAAGTLALAVCIGGGAVACAGARDAQAGAPAGEAQTLGNGKVQTGWVQVPDGRSVLCIAWTQAGGYGGLECDWANAALEGEAP